MKTWWQRSWRPLLAGAAAGLGLRLVFWGNPGASFAPMMAAFILLAPLFVAAVTVYVAELSARRSWAYYFWASLGANLLFVIGTMLALIEGLICAVIIAPLFALLGGLAGLLFGAVCRWTNWPRQLLLSVGILPLMLGAVETELPVSARTGTVEHSIVVDAPPEAVWREILNAEQIRSEELDHAWIFRIGVPLPLAGVTRETAEGPVRRVTMGKNVYFDEVITELREHRLLRWSYRFYDDSFPANALDEHVAIGGHYFDLVDTSYTLTPHGERTELRLRMQYRVSTQFNWYAAPVARFLIGNMQRANLEFYRRRSERR